MDVLKKLSPYVKPYSVIALLGPLLMCVEVAMDLLQPHLMQKMIDTGIANGDNGYVIKLGIYMLVSAFIGLFGGVGCSIFAARASVNTVTDLRRDVFRKTERFSSRNTDAFGAGKLITIVTNDIAAIQQSILLGLKVFVRGPLLFIGAIVIVWFTARELFPVLLIAIPILVAFIWFFSTRSGRLFLKVQKSLDQVNTKLQEMLSGIRVIKAFDRGEYEKGTFAEANGELMKRNRAAEQLILTLMPILMFLVNLGVVAGLWMGAIKVSAGTLQVGVILAFINYLNIMLNGLMGSSHVLMQIARSFPSAGRVLEVLETDIDITESNAPAVLPGRPGRLKFDDVTFRYQEGGEPVLDHVSFEADPGEVIGIIGATGSGKSSLTKLIPRLYDPESGSISIDGVDLRDVSLEDLRSRIGYVPQKAVLFSGSIGDNLRFGKEDADEGAMVGASDSAAAMEFIDRLEGRFEHVLTQGATNLSGGQKQRLSMARAFIKDADILVLDDTTSALDALSEASVQQGIREMGHDPTVFIVSSKISSIKEADQILLLDHGRIVAKGTHEELVATSEEYRATYDAQRGKVMTSHE